MAKTPGLMTALARPPKPPGTSKTEPHTTAVAPTKVQAVANTDRDKVNGAVIAAARQMAAAKPAFAILPLMHFNSDYWHRTGIGSFDVKKGVKPSDAINDVYKNPSKYGFECATAIVITYHKAILDLVGPKAFDAAFKDDLRVGNWKYDSQLKKLLTAPSGASLPGDYTYFKNPGVSTIGWVGGWQGENAINLGNGQYFGHPFGITTDKDIVKGLDNKRWPWSKKEAALSSVGLRLSTDVLKLGTTPNP